jgi:bifunctional non-homologous end joining protein LigD
MRERFPELLAEIAPIRGDFVADGELVMLDNEGRSNWARLRSRHRLKEPKRIARAAATHPAAIFAFDWLWLDGADFRSRTLLQRKDALYRTLPANRRILWSANIPSGGLHWAES